MLKLTILLIFFSGSLFAKGLSGEVKDIINEYIQEKCPQVVEFKASQFNIDPAKIIEIDIKGKSLCYSGRKRVFVRLDNAKLTVLNFTYKAYSNIYVFNKNLDRGVALNNSNVTLKKKEIKNARSRKAVLDFNGLETKFSVKKEETVIDHKVRKIRLVKRGDRVIVNYKSTGINITMTAISKSSGGVGDVVSLLNAGSNIKIKGVVNGYRSVIVGGKL